MGKQNINPLVLIGMIGIFAVGSNFGVQLYRAFAGNRDIWWTPKIMALPLEETGDEFQLFISGKTIQDHLGNDGIFAVDNNGQRYRVAPKDISVRLNNWDKVKASILAQAVLSGVFFGAVIATLLIGLVQTFSKKNNIS